MAIKENVIELSISQVACSSSVPPGWKIEVRDDILRTIVVTAPNGFSAVTTMLDMNPGNVLRMLAQDLLKMS